MTRHRTPFLLGGSFALTALATAQGALQPPPEPAANPTTPEKAVLGKILVHTAGAADDRFGLFGMFASLGVRSALKAIEGDPAYAWTVGELAELAGIPRSAFKSEFQASIGVPLSEYLELRRVRRCQSLLSDGMLAVSDAASQAGFRSRSGFIAAMRRFSR